MSRLPVPGKDDGVWGEILNNYLSQSLTDDGQLKVGTISSAQLQNGSVTTEKLSTEVANTLAKAGTSVQTINGQAPDASGNSTIPAGPQGEQGLPGENGASITITFISAVDWPPPSDPDPLHWYVKVP